MQLDRAPHDSLTEIKQKLSKAQTLVSCINLGKNGGSTADQHFALFMRSNGPLFPMARAVFNENGKKGPARMSRKAKLEFLTKLKEDVKPLLDEANAQAAASKFFKDESLPVDLEECSLCLNELEALKKRKIEELNAELEAMGEAKFSLECMQENKKAVDLFNASMDRACDVDLPEPKKARV
jgi:hypothetical protein